VTETGIHTKAEILSARLFSVQYFFRHSFRPSQSILSGFSPQRPLFPFHNEIPMLAIILQVSITDFYVACLEYFFAGRLINTLLACSSVFFSGLFFLLLTITLFSALLLCFPTSTYRLIFQAQGFSIGLLHFFRSSLRSLAFSCYSISLSEI